MKRKYEALGFVEALVAIMVVGISSVVLMQIAVNTMQNTIQNEIIDNMTQYAVEGAELAQDIANRGSTTGDDIFPEKSSWGRCFSFIKVQDQEDEEKFVYYFAKNTENLFLSFDKTDDRELYKDIAILSEEDELFRVICLDESNVDNPSFVIGSVVVGQRNSDGTITKKNFVKDYSYLTVINL